MPDHKQIAWDTQRYVKTMWLTALITVNTSYARHHSSQTHTNTHTNTCTSWVRGNKNSKNGECRDYMCEPKTCKACAHTCACYAVTENMWDTEGGKCGYVNGNHQSQRSSDTQQESLSLVYTCCYTHTRTGARWFGKHNQEDCCCCFKHRSACINSHKYSYPWTWLFALFMLGVSTRASKTEGAGEKEREKERGSEKQRENEDWEGEKRGN